MAANTKGKKVVRKRRERKNVEKGQVHIRYLLQQHHGDCHRHAGQRPVLGLLRRPGLPWFP